MTVARKRGNAKIKKEKPEDRLKYEIACQLGLGEKVRTEGWGGLTAAETGRIGGIITNRKKQQNAKGAQSNKIEG